MLELGWIKLSRRITQWRWYKNPNTMRLFVHLLLTANYEDHDFEDMTIRRGQRVASYSTLMEELGMTERELRTAINHLKATEEVTYTATRKFSVFTINHYDAYQLATDKETDKGRTDDEPTTNQRQQCKKDKKDKNDEKDKNARTSSSAKQDNCAQWPPSYEEVLAYAAELTDTVQASQMGDKFYRYYEKTGWKTHNGLPIMDWKSSMQYWLVHESTGESASPVPKCSNGELYQSFIYNLDQ